MNKDINANFDIECALLGLMIIEPKAAVKGLEYIGEKDFFYTQNQAAFKAIKETVVDGKIDVKLLISYIKSDTNLTKVLDSGKYIHTLVTKSGYLASIDQYLSQLEEKTKLRELNNIIQHSLEKISVNASFEEIVSEVQTDILNIESRKNIKYFVEIKDIVKIVIEKLNSRLNENGYSGLITGFRDLDNMTNGFQDGDLIIIAARPSMGKTAFALNIAANISQQNYVAFFSLEMPAEQLVTRIISKVSNLSGYKLKKTSLMSDSDWNQLYIANTSISKLKLFIDDSPSLKLEELLWKARRLKRENKLDMIIIDYLQLIPTSHGGLGENRQQEVSKISRCLKQLARELSVPVIALSQLSRRVEQREDKKPMMSDLRESGAIEQDADIIAFLYREEYYKKREDQNDAQEIQETSIIISKHRNGAIGTVDLLFNASKGQFSDKKD